MRLQPERAPDAADRGLTHSRCARHRARRPVRGVWRGLLERLDDHPLDILIVDRARLARTRLVVQPIKATPREATPPTAHRRGCATQPRSDLLAGLTVGRREHDPATERQRLGALWAPGPPLEHLPILNA